MSRTILITGASSGFGAKCAELFAKDGDKVILTARRTDKLDEVKAGLNPNNSYCYELDVTSAESIQSLFSKLKQDNLVPDTLINNAGLAIGTNPFPDTELEDWKTVIDTNIYGLVAVAKSFVENLMEGKPAIIINLGSVAGDAPYPGGNVYGGSKAFVSQFSKNLRIDLFGKNIRVGCIKIGAAETEFSIVRFEGDKEKAKKAYEGYRQLVAEDVASAIHWMVNRPEHVCIDELSIMPTDQTYAGLKTTAS